MKFLIVGLGNIGIEYANTRHNIGFDILDFICNKINCTFTTEKLAYKAESMLKGKKLIFIKPTTYMNLSGKSVQYWMQKEHIPNENILIITDDISLPVGKIRIRSKGSDGGHNGLKDINEKLLTNEYPRLRFGVGNEFPKGRQVDFVLGKFNENDRITAQLSIEKCYDAILSFACEGIGNTMTKFNQ